jgi:predicted amidophosphoribosyltransferase
MSLASSLLGPPPCAGCGLRYGPLCPACRRRLVPPRTIPLLAGVDRVVAPWEHAGPARGLVLDLKLGARRWAAEPMAAGMCAAAARAVLRGGVVTWVPAPRRSIRVRGYDHAEVLARRVATGLGLPLGRRLRRTRRAGDQAALTAAERRSNLAGAFVAGPCSGGVILVDDVVTTGATAEACARALLIAGAEGVELLAACRRS